jgi:hypothetical protein
MRNPRNTSDTVVVGAGLFARRLRGVLRLEAAAFEDVEAIARRPVRRCS